MMPLLDLLGYLLVLALGAALMHIVDKDRERAVKTERDRTESWKSAYHSLRYDMKPMAMATLEEAPAPLQLSPQDAWASRCNGQVRTGRRA